MWIAGGAKWIAAAPDPSQARRILPEQCRRYAHAAASGAEENNYAENLGNASARPGETAASKRIATPLQFFC